MTLLEEVNNELLELQDECEFLSKIVQAQQNCLTIYKGEKEWNELFIEHLKNELLTLIAEKEGKSFGKKEKLKNWSHKIKRRLSLSPKQMKAHEQIEIAPTAFASFENDENIEKKPS
ncbi:hypothetical protein AB6A40_009850 [Gnathostoma spinigerum]|uniref:Uncharacterized protein n=1 Tax=Gnathostoma spinigerum TaxID=75299 RepID=A0ABD6EZY4_9BILA